MSELNYVLAVQANSGVLIPRIWLRFPLAMPDCGAEQPIRYCHIAVTLRWVEGTYK